MTCVVTLRPPWPTPATSTVERKPECPEKTRNLRQSVDLATERRKSLRATTRVKASA